MRAVDIVRKKRDGCELSAEEIAFLIRGYCGGSIPEYQMAAFLMAVFFRGMVEAEVVALTEAMRLSGEVMDLQEIRGRKVDKHSTGGVGDKTSLIIAPAVAAAGVTVPMMAGRGLGHTGGTLDKLEAIPGFSVRLNTTRFKEQLVAARLAFAGQSDQLVPADKKLYALRDATATVASQALIVASIMSKKLAEGIDGLVLDVKTGSGAFMKQQRDAESLARAMVNIGKASGIDVVALITDMNQPLGEFAGNALEVMECVEVLKGSGPADLVSLCEDLSAQCLILGGAASSVDGGKRLFREMVSSGRALEKFREVVRLQGGNPRAIDNYDLLPQARWQTPLLSPARGFIAAMETETIGTALCVLGAGRETMQSGIDPAVGIRLHKKVGDFADAGEPLCTLFYNDTERCQETRRRLLEAYSFAETAPERPPLVKQVIA